MSRWDDLAAALAADGGAARLWWRDDDAMRVTEPLERLLALSAQFAIPVALAVIPRDSEPELVRRVAVCPLVSVLQHGWGHDNHAPPGEAQDEYGPHRPLDTRLAEIAEGWRRLEAFERRLPVFVPPWNRMDTTLLPHLPHLPQAGLAGISAWGPRGAKLAAPGIARVNVHVDIMNWTTGRFAGEDAVLTALLAVLAGQGDGGTPEPVGLMTHHAYHDAECWDFLGRLFALGSGFWLGARQAFWP